MKPLSIRAIAEALGLPAGELPDEAVAAVCTDTRALCPGSLFVALEGDRFDGHDYVAQALASGARWAVISRDVRGDGTLPGVKLLRVADTRAALMAIARLYRQSLPVRVVGITGSVGKTTTKEMAACVLGARYQTLKTPANLNNEVGLSTTILSLEEAHEAAVLELGTDGPGQMEPLARCALPDVGILTGIGVSHIEAFGSREGIREEKLALRAGMPDGGVLLLNGEDDILEWVSDERLRVLRFGVDNPRCDIRARAVAERGGGCEFEILWQGGVYPATLPAIGRHNLLDALAAFGAGVSLGVEPAAAAAALAGYRPEGMRQRMRTHRGVTVVEDCYNASPDSMRAALQTLGGMPCTGKRVAVLSDMLELGAIAEDAHREVGACAAAQNIDRLLCTGTLSAHYVEGAVAAGMNPDRAEHLPDQDALLERLRGTLEPGDTAWFKASRGMRLEQLLARLYDL